MVQAPAVVGPWPAPFGWCDILTNIFGANVTSGTLVIHWPDGGHLEHDLPLPQSVTPWQYVAMIGRHVGDDRRCATWWIQP